jgi:phosphoribosylformylglycinamidine synthase
MLKQNEYDLISETLGRRPNQVEEVMFDAMWSEHCSYKSSKHWFKLFTDVTNSRVKLGIGEGAGLIDIGDGQLIGLALESHNHPSAIDPFNGAATGVGGIIRDIISQGCHPIALLDSLRFGELHEPHTQFLFDQVVRGISSYGNCVGIPNIGGDLVFDKSYHNNALVNVMCIGLVNESDVIRSKATHVGDKLVLFGAKTGKDGIGGVSFASKDLTSSSDYNRPAVQIGDPAIEKILIDIIHELNKKNLVEGMQDLGGGGFTCASSEIVFRGKRGAKIYIDNIPLRVPRMNYWEIMISESQERMLAVIKDKNLKEAFEIFDKHEVSYALVGEVIEEDKYIVINNDGEIISDVPVSFLVDGFPIYTHKQQKNESIIYSKLVPERNDLDNYFDIFTSPSLGSKHFIYDQYDKHVQIRTMVESGDNAGILDIGNGKAIGAVLDTNDYQVAIDPFQGTINSVLRCIGNVFASGLEPIAMVDCLNFGNPENPGSYWEFVESIKGMAEVVKTLKIPIVGGNVSLYNETEKENKKLKINPTPTIGLVGLTTDKTKISTSSIKNSGSKIIFLGTPHFNLTGSEAVRIVEGIQKHGSLIKYDIRSVWKIGSTINELNAKDVVLSTKYISRGGLLPSLVKMVAKTKFGLFIDLKNGFGPEINQKHSLTEILFGESEGCYLIETQKLEEISAFLHEKSLRFYQIADVLAEKTLLIDNKEYNLTNMEKNWKNAIEQYMVT